jgi:hypothetical protein
VADELMMRKPIVKLITFGGGNTGFREAAARLIVQARDFPSIDVSKAYFDTDLPADYFQLFSAITESCVTGYRLYSWKPFLIHAEFSALCPDDILVYIDAGCELNKRGIPRFDDYLSFTSRNDALLFELQHPNRFWSKNHPKLVGYPEHYFRNQLAGGIVFLKKCERTTGFVNAYVDLCAYENGALLKEPDSTETQIPGFRNHRHDQSCLSICAYLHDVATMPDETWFPDWSHGKNYPILAFRNKSGVSMLNDRLRTNVLTRAKRFLRRLRHGS